ncbi:shikimate dehydrogenase [Desulfurobacterium atlanticum]|uniref:Shikimate dehydrogenase (NADP(+)) n=1 Tax=Desulfurobacterium atlanticum TaxID=240169 RepID=A0A238ZBF5_9BACT|nr:shikimate dehydrogenase [Desulfurobacterium atlanticum]SNR80261.1 shikimate dehydrogenase [Desulfurobacterium atlanticum]
MRITGKTEVYGIFGFPVKHSLSPLMQTAAFRALGIDAVYVPFEVSPENLDKAVEGLKAMNIKGVNVTVPLKERIIPYLDSIDKTAEFMGAANTVKNIDGKLYGYNTDGDGFVDSLIEEGIEVRDRKVLIIGAGGSAKAIAYALLKSGVNRIVIANRTIEKAESLADKLKGIGDVNTVSLLNINSVIDKFDILINTTSVGMEEDDPFLFDYNHIKSYMVVVDIIYKPFETKLLKVAKSKGAKTINGLGMLIHQGARAFKIWTGKEAPVEVMRKVLLEGLK